MATITKRTTKQTPDGAEAELEDLDVREVSVVDKPANQRRFLVIKSEETGGVTVTLEANAMPENQNQVASQDTEAQSLDAMGLMDFLGLTVTKNEEPPQTEPPVDAPKLEEGQSLQGQVHALTKGLLQRLTKAAGDLKEDQEPSPEAVQELAQIAKGLDFFAGQIPHEEGEVEIVQDDLEGGPKVLTHKALDHVMKATNAAKQIAQDAEHIPAEIPARLQAARILLEKAVGVEVSEEPEAQEAPALEGVEIFKAHGQDASDDPELILKVGAKMKKTRLSAFKKAIDLLSSILAELDGAEKVDESEKVTKAEDQDLTGKLEKGFSLLEGRLSSQIAEALKPLTGQIDAVQKRVDDMASANPGGRGDTGPEEVHKQEDPAPPSNFWAGVL